MSLFIESICLIDGVFRNLVYHEKRMNRTRHYFFKKQDDIRLEEMLQGQDIPQTGKVKCRIVYGTEIRKIDFIPYVLRFLDSIRLVWDDHLDYHFKYENRAAFAMRKNKVDEDEIIIIRDGYLTDTSYSNLAFFDGKSWITPSTPLLPGIMRQSLLDKEEIAEKPITPKMLDDFSGFKLINAMLDLKESPFYDRKIIEPVRSDNIAGGFKPF